MLESKLQASCCVLAPCAQLLRMRSTPYLSNALPPTHPPTYASLQVMQPGDTVVDATCGNGWDTLYMAQSVGPSGRVFGLDIQVRAAPA